MNYKVSYHAEIKKDLERVPNNIKSRLCSAIENRVLVDPLKFGKPLRRSQKGYRKLRVGDYRIIFRVEKDLVIILKIGHRREVYKKKREEN